MGKFEKANRPQAQQAASRKRKKNDRRVPMLIGGIALAAVVIVGCVVGIFLLKDKNNTPAATVTRVPDDGKLVDNLYIAGVNVGGMTKVEAFSALRNVDYTQNMTVELYRRDAAALYTLTYDPKEGAKSFDIYGKPLDTGTKDPEVT